MPNVANCTNCGESYFVNQVETSSCERCAKRERFWFVFAPAHGTYVLAIDAEHAWKVSGNDDRVRDRSIILPAFLGGGNLLIAPSEDTGTDKILHLRDLRRLKSTPCKDVPQKAPIESFAKGLYETPAFTPGNRGGAVIMIGSGATRHHLDMYLKHEPEAEVWTMNDERHKRATRHFQIHLRAFFGRHGEEVFDTSDLEIPVYTAESYPYNEIRRIWLNSTIDYMLAVADMDGFERVYLPGIDFGGPREGMEMESSLYWLGVIEGKGGKVFLSPLFRGFDCKVYGLNEERKS